MTDHRRPTRQDWLAGLTAGALLGCVFLGMGGRAGMRAVAVLNGAAGTFTIEGTITVVLLGALCGAIVAAIFLLARILFPRRRWGRVAFFWAIITAVALRGISPLTVANAVIFLPLFIAHGTLLNLYWCRVYLRGRAYRISFVGTNPSLS